MPERPSRTRDRAASSIENVRRYYRITLPFYEDETAGRGDLAFWRALCREWRPRSILELGCGQARVTSVLSATETVVGLDLSLEMLARASDRARKRRIRLVCADARRFAFSERFDLIVAPDDPMSHWTRLEDRRAILRCVARHLAPGGRFVLDGLYRPEASRFTRPARGIGGERGGTVREVWEPLRGNTLWRARYLYRTDDSAGAREIEASFRARSWLPSEVRPMLASCGLSVERLWGDFDRASFGAGSPRLLVVARRSALRSRGGRGFQRGGRFATRR